ncbi:hypothetical protein [Alishewanella jeotgali]|uniref:Uncharacterized protein n=1 Tax=Alishewanella jeotgali KCTC 22429 TaxID=1129374 RepID=H3ZGT6_9ALTE|nr:hypothetical protein [Alishewanella jeotgali]EHR40212.1 hypothetical protein AJE_12930 [Alishewanella jeotgali KCTC 22429]
MRTLTTLLFTSVVSLTSTQLLADPAESLRAAMTIQQQQLQQQLALDVRQQSQYSIESTITQMPLVLQQPGEMPQLAQQVAEKAAVTMVAE